jgi:hypothetical protein
MKQIFPLSRIIITALLLILVFSLSYSYATVPPVVTCLPVTGTPPVIDGVISPGEWPTSPQLTLLSPPYPIATNFYCMNDVTNLYILVDAIGDTTDDDTQSPCAANNLSHCDECLLVFGGANQSSRLTAEVWGKAGDILGTNPHFPANAQVAIGFNSHRFYEWKIPLSSISAAPGQTIDFSSPKLCKGVGTGDPCYYQASMPYDGSTGNDNGWPSGVDAYDKSTWGQIQLDPATQSIPTLNEWSMIIFMVIAALGSIYFLRRRQRAG